jgi:hypothetical protein
MSWQVESSQHELTAKYIQDKESLTLLKLHTLKVSKSQTEK